MLPISRLVNGRYFRRICRYNWISSYDEWLTSVSIPADLWYKEGHTISQNSLTLLFKTQSYHRISMSSELTAYRYGKDKIRVFRVVREANIQHIVEYNVCSLLEGDVSTSYTEADNSVIVATDSSAYRQLFACIQLILSNDQSRTLPTVSFTLVRVTHNTDNIQTLRKPRLTSSTLRNLLYISEHFSYRNMPTSIKHLLPSRNYDGRGYL
jgi:hypothetical protein